jgi:hypothetical protein
MSSVVPLAVPTHGSNTRTAAKALLPGKLTAVNKTAIKKDQGPRVYDLFEHLKELEKKNKLTSGSRGKKITWIRVEIRKWRTKNIRLN